MKYAMPAINTKGRHFRQELILMTVRWYEAYSLSYRDIEELMAQRGLFVDHTTIHRWVEKYAPQLKANFRRKKKATADSWHMDETYIKIKGDWNYLYCVFYKHGETIDFMLSKHRDESTVRVFLNKAIWHNGLPKKVVIDKSGANLAALESVNLALFLMGCFFLMVDILQVKYLNNMVEQSHRSIKRKKRQALGFKSVEEASATIAENECWRMLKKGQHCDGSDRPAFEQFYALA